MGFRPAQLRSLVDPNRYSRARVAESGGSRAHAEFEGGNLEAVEWISPSHLRFAARADASPRPLWFYFCLESAQVPTVTCELTNADDCFGPRHAWRYARPVYSTDGRQWRRVERVEYRETSDGAGTFQFSVPIGAPTVYVAYCHPYTTADLATLLREVTGTPWLKLEDCGPTEEGRSLPHLVFGDPGADPAIWVLARQHAGESPASWVVDGIVRQLAQVNWIGASGRIHVIPMVDPDGVVAGRYGKDERPVDFNRDWCSNPSRRETSAILAAIRRARPPRRFSLVLDIHASHHGDTESYLFGETARSADEHDRQSRFVAQLAELGPASIGLRPTDLRVSPAPPQSARAFLAHELGCPALTLEVSYHLTQSGRYPGSQDYSALGAATALALIGLFRC